MFSLFLQFYISTKIFNSMVTYKRMKKTSNKSKLKYESRLHCIDINAYLCMKS